MGSVGPPCVGGAVGPEDGSNEGCNVGLAVGVCVGFGVSNSLGAQVLHLIGQLERARELTVHSATGSPAHSNRSARPLQRHALHFTGHCCRKKELGPQSSSGYRAQRSGSGWPRQSPLGAVVGSTDVDGGFGATVGATVGCRCVGGAGLAEGAALGSGATAIGATLGSVVVGECAGPALGLAEGSITGVIGAEVGSAMASAVAGSSVVVVKIEPWVVVVDIQTTWLTPADTSADGFVLSAVTRVLNAAPLSVLRPSTPLSRAQHRLGHSSQTDVPNSSEAQGCVLPTGPTDSRLQSGVLSM